MFETLFSPILINKTEIKNRIAFPSMGLLYSLDQKLNERYNRFYLERAQGGAGIVTVGPIGIGMLGVGVGAPSIASDQAIPSFAALTQTIQNAGARAWIQLYHGGAYVKPLQIGGQQPFAPTAFYCEWSKAYAREMTIDDIKKTQEAFIRCAERAREAGFDGVEIIGSAGYLINQFLSPLRNQRTDDYGGSFENRIRFAREIIEQMRARLGSDYPITIRMAGNDFVPGSLTDIDTREVAMVYEKAGADAINVTGGWHEAEVPQLTMSVPRGAYTYLAQNIKNVVSIPVLASNRISDPWLAEKILHDGCADMINLGRVLIADPYWPAKVRAGNPEQIVPCVGCLQGCMDELMSARPVKCMVNARAGYEGERMIVRTSQPQKIMIVGAGPGGLEAAVRASEGGHQVELYEKSDRMGGQLWLAGTPPDKQELWELIKYYQQMIRMQGISVIFNTEVDMELINNKKPDYVIAAEGAETEIPPIEGFDDPRVVSAWDVLEKDLTLGERIAVIGGGAVGLETAHFMARKGTINPETLYFLFKNEAESPDRLHELVLKGNKDITVFELLPYIGSGVGKSSKWGLINNLKKHGVKIVTGARILSYTNGILAFEKDGEKQSLPFDNVVTATGSKPVRKLAVLLENSGIPFSIIGDSTSPGQITDAIHSAFLAVMNNL